jgi:MFS family permease
MALVVALRFAGRGPVGTFFNVYLDDGLGTSTVLIGALVAAGQLLSVPAALAVPPLEARWGNGPLIIWGSLGMALGTLPLALIPHWTAAGLGFLGSTVMLSLSTGPVRVYSQELVAPRWRSVTSGAVMAGSGLSYAAMSLWGGFAVATLGYRSIFLVGGALAALAALVFWVYFRVPRGELARTAKE